MGGPGCEGGGERRQRDPEIDAAAIAATLRVLDEVGCTKPSDGAVLTTGVPI